MHFHQRDSSTSFNSYLDNGNMYRIDSHSLQTAESMPFLTV